MMSSEALPESGRAGVLPDISPDRLPQAVLIEGPDDAERDEAARRLAGAVVCRAGAGAPCGRCAACRKSAGGLHPDIVFVGGPNEEIRVEQIRDLRRDAYILPHEAARKVFVIFNAENMNVHAQNALLKLLEEPPARVVLILTAENRALLLPTVLSRLIVYALPPTPGRAGGDASPEDVAAAEGYIGALCEGAQLLALERLLVLDGRPRETMLAFSQLVCLFIRHAVFLSAALPRQVPGQFREGAARLAGAFSLNELTACHAFFFTVTEDCRKNANVAALIGRIAAFGQRLHRRKCL